MKSMHEAIPFMALILLSSCAWVKLNHEGERVQVMTMEAAVGCKRLGKTTVSTLAKVVGLNRYQESMQDELNILARNSAGELGGDAVVPISDIKEGRQVFAVFRCKPSVSEN